MFQKAVFLMSALIIASSVQAETVRTRLTKENRFPDQFHPEIGMAYNFVDFIDSSEIWSFDSYVRLGLADGFALTATVPYVDREDGATKLSESGLGDAQVGLEWRMWEDIFHYPYVLSHIVVDTDTGEEKDKLGDGETSVTVGVTLGTVMHDLWHWTAEARYELNDNTDDMASAAVTIGYAVSEQFQVMAEAEIRDEPAPTTSDTPILIVGGFFYQISDFLSLSVHGGAENNSEKDIFVSSKVALSF